MRLSLTSRRSLTAIALLLTLPTLVLAQGTTGVIRGSVVDADTGEPIPAVNLVLVRADGTITQYGAFSDKEGDYVAINIPPGRYTLRAAMLGYRVYEVENLLVTVGVETRTDFRLQRMSGGLVIGQVTDQEGGRPLAGAVLLLLDEEGKPTSFGTRSDERGRFLLEGVPPGTYDLEVSREGYHTMQIKDLVIKAGVASRSDFLLKKK